ncbi:hypothetical protein [Arthrobacter sp. ERGS1:01]|uniref:hypothetical protein n=1 Tax=Arthrobacter sp. ERGS1:01 TaxID=1704044 RepID=UPI000AE5F938|nr:hypothetical protein [Arthrobacter sp. ERGS1:01]
MESIFPRRLKPRSPSDKLDTQNEDAVRLLISGVTTLVDDLEAHAARIEVTAPAAARHLRVTAQQLASLTLAAVEAWPKVTG